MGFNLQTSLLIFILVYGIAYGINNTFVRIKWLIHDGKFNQDKLGKVLDSSFYVAIGYLIYTNWS